MALLIAFVPISLPLSLRGAVGIFYQVGVKMPDMKISVSLCT